MIIIFETLYSVYSSTIRGMGMKELRVIIAFFEPINTGSLFPIDFFLF